MHNEFAAICSKMNETNEARAIWFTKVRTNSFMRVRTNSFMKVRTNSFMRVRTNSFTRIHQEILIQFHLVFVHKENRLRHHFHPLKMVGLYIIFFFTINLMFSRM